MGIRIANDIVFEFLIGARKIVARFCLGLSTIKAFDLQFFSSFKRENLDRSNEKTFRELKG